MAHIGLKQEARQLLVNMGCIEIKEEVRFGNLIIDIIGYKNNKIIAIECGNLSLKNKIEKIKEIPDIIKVLHLKHKSPEDPNLKISIDKYTKTKILNFLNSQKDTINIRNIAKSLKIAYPTAQKYVALLEAEKKINVRKYGNMKLIEPLDKK